jgi:GAF domain-containing protein
LAVIGVFDKALGGSESPNWIFPVASRSDGKVEIAARYAFDVFEGIPDAIFTDRPVVLNNLNENDRLDPMYRMFFHQDSPAGSSIIVPLVLGSFIIGFAQGYYDTPVDFPEAQLQRLLAVAGQAAIAVQSMLLLEQAQARARQEQRIREVTAQVFSAADIDSIMRKTVEQVGRALGTPAYIYLSQDRSPQGIPEP